MAFKRSWVRSPPSPPKIDLFLQVDFFIQADRLGISSRISVYIIAAYAAYIITPLGVYIVIVGSMIYSGFAVDLNETFRFTRSEASALLI